MFDTNLPLSLYIHIPWCVRKCPYCDFNSHEIKNEIPETHYLAALLADLENELPLIWGRPIQSIFFGGGTPSTVSPEGIDQLLSGVRARLKLSPHAEITLEANPGTVDQARFNGYRQAGVNRISLGIQSFNDAALRQLGRIHDHRQALSAVEAAQHAGFARINLDLMFGLPGQDLAAARHDVEQAIALRPSHVSYYQLTIEPNTGYARQPPALPHEDLIDDMHQQGLALLASHGFRRYEVSAFAQEDEQCRHNLNYWQFGDYLGIGAGAHGKISHAPSREIRRRWKTKHPKQYLAGAMLSGEEVIASDKLVLEFMMNALRLVDGVDLALLTQRTGKGFDAIAEAVKKGGELGLLRHDVFKNRLRPTERGLRFLNDALALFL